jgi:hypothetical protein
VIALCTPIEIESSLSPDECAERLQAITVSRFASFVRQFSLPAYRFPLVGAVRSQSCSLRYRTLYRNSFQRRLDLKFIRGKSGTSLVGTLALPVWAIAFCGIWILFAILSSLVFLADRGQVQQDMNSGLYLIPLGTIAFMVGLLTFCLWLSTRTEKKLLSAVTHSVSGRLVIFESQ